MPSKALWIGGGIALAVVLAGCAAIRTLSEVEQPTYDTLLSEEGFSLRSYPRLTVAEVIRNGERYPAINAGFRPLANYIFAKKRADNASADRIAMTAPVIQQTDADGQWAIQFIMPAKYTLGNLPVPAEDVRLREIPPRHIAAIQFSGRASDQDFINAEAQLRRWMQAKGLPAAGEAILAYYNPPITPGFMRRNEVLIPVHHTAF